MCVRWYIFQNTLRCRFPLLVNIYVVGSGKKIAEALLCIKLRHDLGMKRNMLQLLLVF